MSFVFEVPVEGFITINIDFKRQNHGPGNATEHHDGASYDFRPVQSCDYCVLCMLHLHLRLQRVIVHGN